MEGGGGDGLDFRRGSDGGGGGDGGGGAAAGGAAAGATPTAAGAVPIVLPITPVGATTDGEEGRLCDEDFEWYDRELLDELELEDDRARLFRFLSLSNQMSFLRRIFQTVSKMLSTIPRCFERL